MQRLIKLAEKNNIEIVEMQLAGNLKGLYADRVIALKKGLSEKEKNCMLAEELGHHFTTHGNILDQTDVSNRKQELKARAWGIQTLANLDLLIKGYFNTYNASELAEYLNITDEYLADCINYYTAKYGNVFKYKDYIVQLTPLKIIEQDKELLL